MKIVMRENFVNPSLVINANDEVNHLEEESIVISLAIPCYHIVLAQSSTYILLSAQVHLATVTPKLDN